ncbi:MAG: DUF4340 domain-containing protein, partial [Thermoanaerobaculia bacterium]|nr:DUF4340 domain-containing protein [Thermoanaerobaculia bacterium]
VRVLEDGTAADFGLEPPQLSIELVTATGTTSLEIGSELPASSRRVARLGGDPHLFVIEAPFVAAASKAAGDWRDRRLFPGERRDIQSIRLRGAQAEVLLGKRGDRFWLESPVTDVADRDAVEALLSAVTEVSAETFVDGLPASDVDLGLDPGLGAIEVVLQGQEEPFRIVMGTSTTSEPNGDSVEGTESVSKDLAPPPADTSHYARVGGTLVTTSAVLVGPLARSTDDWRSRAWLTVPTYDIEKLVLGGDDPNLVLTRDGVDWKRGEETIEYTVVNQFLTTLSGLRAEAVDTSVTLRDLPTRLSLDVTAKDGTLTTLKIAGNDGDAVWATSSGRSLGLRMPQGTVEQLKTGLEAIRSAEVLTPDPPGDLSSGGGSPDVDADDETAAMKDFS